MALHPLVLDALGFACCTRTKVRRDIHQNALPSVCQEMMMSPIISPNAVETSQADEALKAAPSVKKVAALSPLRSGVPKFFVAATKSKPVAAITSS